MQNSFFVKRYLITWICADPQYDQVFRLVPSIAIFESASEQDPGATAFLSFLPHSKARGASFDAEANVYYLEYDLVFASEVIDLLKTQTKLELVYKEQENRKWATLLTGSIMVGQSA